MSEIVICTIYTIRNYTYMVYTPICTQHFMFLRISATSSPSNLIRSESSAKSSAALPFSIERPRNHPLPNAEVRHVDLFCQFSWVLKSSQILGAPSWLRILSWNFPGSFLSFTETCHPRVWLALRHEPIPALESWLWWRSVGCRKFGPT